MEHKDSKGNKDSIEELKKTLSDKNDTKQEEKEIKDKGKHELKKHVKIKKKDENQKKIDDLTETLQRLQAEFDNYRKRIEKEKKEFVKYANAEFISNILSFIDTFEIALKNTHNHEKFVKGIELVYSQLYGLLEKEGLKSIECLGKKFDPHLHEVMLKEKSNKEEDIIT